MAITKYLQKCDYSIGGLQPYIYLIHKNTLTVRIKAKGVEVFFKEVPKNGAETEIYKIYGASCVYNQEETYHNKYRFNSTLELTINEQYKEPFLYGLRTLRTNQYYIIVEDKKGTQYLINPELYTNLNYEYNFFDGGDTQNSCVISWNNLSNYPLLIMDEKIDNNFVLLFEECPYNIGSIEWLRICHKGELTTKDDGVKITDMYFSNIDLLHTIDFLKETFTYNETYDGNMFRTTLSFSIPLSDNQFNWHYNLLEFEKNRYTAFFKTTNHNYFVSGVEKGLRPKYNITTSEDDETPNMINITFEQTSQYPMIWTDSVVQYQWREDEQMCIGYDKYQMLAQQYSLDWGRTWVDTNPIVKKKGDIIESDSEECKKYQWVENGEVCVVDSNEIVKWKETDGYICQDCGKYRKLQKMVSTDSGKTFKDTDEYYIGAPMLDEEGDCQFVMARWVDAENQYLCFPVDETKTKWEVTRTTCIGYDLYNSENEYVTNDGERYYESGYVRIGDKTKENCCACGYLNTEYRYDSTVCSTAITESNPTILGNIFEITRVQGDWIRDGYTFTSNDINDNEITIERIYFRVGEPTDITFTINQSSESGYDYLVISNLDKPVVSGSPTSTGSSYNYYNHKSKTTGSTSMTISNTEEHFVELMYQKDYSNSYYEDNVIVTLGVEDLKLQPYSKYDKYYLWEYCTDEYDTINRKTEQCIYYINEINSCDCEWTGTTWQWDGEETICGKELCGEEDILFLITNVEGDWLRDGYTFTSNTIGYSQSTILTISFYVSEDTTLNIDFAVNSESKLDKYYRTDIDGDIFIDDASGGYGGSSSTPCKKGKHTMMFKYQKGSSTSSGSDNVIITLRVDGACTYDPQSEYEVWRETDCDDFTGNIDYRNPKKSYKCGYVTYQWREDENNVCGNALPENTTEVNEAPELNTDFE